MIMVASVLLTMTAALAADETNPWTNWTLSQAAYMDGNKIVLTPDQPDQVGAAWNGAELDLLRNFDFTFNIYLGQKDDDGADGIAFVMALQESAAQPGQALGYQGIEPSVAVEIDNYPNDGNHEGENFSDPLGDHVAVNVGGNPDHAAYDLPVVEVGNLEDGVEHTLRINWNAEAKTLRVYIDDMNEEVLQYSEDIVDRFLTGHNIVRFGFTGSTGLFSNFQYVVPVNVRQATEEPQGPGLTRNSWTLAGSAKWESNKIVLTPDQYDMAGAAWYGTPIDLTKDFDLQFRVNLGSRDEDGADGIAFVLAPEDTPLEPGQGLGYAGITPSVAVEIDTNPDDDLGDPLEDHLAIDVDGSVDHTGSGLPVFKVANIEDGREHNFRITWTASEHMLQVYWDNAQNPVLIFTSGIVTDYLDGINKVRFGFTGSTGYFTNKQYIVPVRL
jgi:hypothetical protein